MQNIRDKLDAQAREYGAQVIDVRIKRADLPEGRRWNGAFTRMETDRQEEAATIRARANATRRSSAPKPRPKPRGSMPTAYGKDPEFYDFYRAMQSYRHDLRQSGAGPEQHHPVARQRISPPVPRTR